VIDPRAYTISVRRGEFEGEVCFEARVRELPDVAEYADTFEEAYALAIDTIETTADILAQKGRSLPPPEAHIEEFSGRVTLRMPRTLHHAAVLAAEDEGVSLNQFIALTLQERVTAKTALVWLQRESQRYAAPDLSESLTRIFSDATASTSGAFVAETDVAVLFQPGAKHGIPWFFETSKISRHKKA
jgi:predicted HicB family RNase H-like nuclease